LLKTKIEIKSVKSIKRVCSVLAYLNDIGIIYRRSVLSLFRRIKPRSCSAFKCELWRINRLRRSSLGFCD